MDRGKEFVKQAILKYKDSPFNTYENSFGSYKRFIRSSAEKYNLSYKLIKGKKFSYLLHDNKQIGKLTGLKPPSTGKVASQICNDKFRLENFLREMKLPVLSSHHIFDKHQAYDLICNDNSHTYVLKPLSLAGGDGIELDIDAKNFSDAWDNSIKIQEKKNVKHPSCIVQPYIKGFDVRISIIEGRFISALLRLPANIIGDGKNSIKKLIEDKNTVRSNTPYFKSKLIQMDQNLKTRLKIDGLDFESILGKDEVIILNDISNLTLGGESIDITDEISADIKKTALEAVAAIPELYSAGVDLMCENFITGNGQILEINTNANHTMHHVPLKGNPKYPFDALVESILIKYKTKNGIPLTKVESSAFKEITHFNTLKYEMMTKIFSLTNI